ncbi:MAG: hypothetical protein IPG68_12360 [Micrococcales bacterium]|nr:hypothetical protein [Micrococcales bacterium]
MRRVLILFLTFALAGVVTPVAAATGSTRVDYWLDRDPGPWTGGMVVIRRGGKYWAYAKFFEGRVCLSGRRNGSTVQMKGTFEQFEREPVSVRWRLRKGMPKVAYTLGTAGEWRRVNRADFVTGTTTGTRLVDTARITTPARWRSACAWTGSLTGAVPRGKTYLKTTTPPGTELRVLFVRRGQTVRYAWIPSAGHPNCFRGAYRDGQLVGHRVTDHPTGAIWSQEPIPLRVGRRTWTLGGQRYREIRRSAKYAAIDRRALRKTLRRCNSIAWPVPATLPSPSPDTPTPAPAPTAPVPRPRLHHRHLLPALWETRAPRLR